MIESPNSTFADLSTSNYECPSIFDKNGSKKLDEEIEKELQTWIKESLDQGMAFLKSCRAYPDLDKAIDIITKTVNDKIAPQTATPSTLSDVWANNTKRQVREVCATLSNIRPSWLYEANSSRDPLWLDQAQILNGLSDDWYKTSNVDISLYKLLQLGTVQGTGYVSPVWNPWLNNEEGGIELKLYAYDEVIPVQLPRDFDLQKAYAVILVDEMPINLARKTFFTKRNRLVPDRGASRMAKDSVYSAAKEKVSGFWDSIAGNNKKRKVAHSPVIDILYIYIDDYSVNPNNFEYQMGDPNDSWSYVVPYIGQDIAVGFNPDGSTKTRKAQPRDCRLYPNRRLIIASKTCILYDGPNYWWHRRVPIIKYSPDEWIFSYLGFSMAAEVLTLDRSANKMRRAIEDALNLKIDPPLAIDEHSMSKTQAESKSLRTPGRRIRGKLQMGKFIEPICGPETYNVGSDHFAWVDKTEDKLKEILGIPDLRNLQQARQVPASDTIGQFFAQAGAIVTQMSRAMDPILAFIADCNRHYFMQFYDLPRRIKILGADGVSKQDFDYEPATLTPKSLPNEPMVDSTGAIVLSGGFFKSKSFERAKNHLGNFRTSIEPTSLHQITHMQRKLLLMQATKLIPGFPMIDPETLAKELDIPNWGHYEGDTIKAKVKAFMEEQVHFQVASQVFSQEQMAKLQMMIQMMMQQNSPEGQLTSAFNNLTQGLANGGSNGGGGDLGFKRGAGHPPSFENPPTLAAKADMDTTIKT